MNIALFQIHLIYLYNLLCLLIYASHVNESYTELTHNSNMCPCPHYLLLSYLKRY
jgi:hypothetical protein